MHIDLYKILLSNGESFKKCKKNSLKKATSHVDELLERFNLGDCASRIFVIVGRVYSNAEKDVSTQEQWPLRAASEIHYCFNPFLVLIIINKIESRTEKFVKTRYRFDSMCNCLHLKKRKNFDVCR